MIIHSIPSAPHTWHGNGGIWWCHSRMIWCNNGDVSLSSGMDKQNATGVLFVYLQFIHWRQCDDDVVSKQREIMNEMNCWILGLFAHNVFTPGQGFYMRQYKMIDETCSLHRCTHPVGLDHIIQQTDQRQEFKLRTDTPLVGFAGEVWASCQICKIAGCACAGNARNVFPASVGWSISTCITARAWRTCRDVCRDR